MQIQASARQSLARLAATPPASGAGVAANASTVAADPAAIVRLSEAGRAKPAGEAATATFDTRQGERTLDIDTLLSPPSAPVNLQDVPLLLPTQRNVEALGRHASARVAALLAEHGIDAPTQIRFDAAGQLQLPAGYADAEAFTQALDADPVLARELRTVNALASHVAGIARAAAGQPTETQIALQFGAAGQLIVTADGAPLLRAEST
ncbi:hypothetical protein G3580_07830 [Nitrogeniibacter mangrovi]|uniref:Uncharacterized protein n=1 Tax=Nitrogeniibacter mangrovi TaxID=2016596 RepID=A0A6C1B1R2_9RHOO|nr:hypothetical protein [Nitrogeniibacter mangrovi]QID17561.1 hypothetical protein G3580_07830 [Nitrogeniibacter mangrovi]